MPWNSKPSSVTQTVWVRLCHSRTRREPGLILGPGGGAIVPPVSNSAVKVINRRCVTLEAPPWAISNSR